MVVICALNRSQKRCFRKFYYKHIKGSKERYLLGEKNSMRFFRVYQVIKRYLKTGKR